MSVRRRSHPPIPSHSFHVRHSAHRPLPALFAILILIGVMVIASMLLKDPTSQDRRSAGLPDQPSAELPAE
jgi:hypothetical protein